jgi:putative endopeptidase
MRLLPRRRWRQVLDIETEIAKASYDQVKLRDIDANYHKMSYTSSSTTSPASTGATCFLASGMPAFDSIDVGQPEPIHEVEKILADTPLEALKTYAEAKVISGAASQLERRFPQGGLPARVPR